MPVREQFQTEEAFQKALRDYFAAKAMAAMSLKWDGAYSPNDRLRDQPKADARWVATAAYRYADAMLKARALSNIEGGK